uniref:Melibiase_C domain-containing protein n=1 Tax=Steinernema glaseri TaxID=37863 RepID=A0A1I7ZAW0_9BILA
MFSENIVFFSISDRIQADNVPCYDVVPLEMGRHGGTEIAWKLSLSPFKNKALIDLWMDFGGGARTDDCIFGKTDDRTLILSCSRGGSLQISRYRVDAYSLKVKTPSS